MLCSLNKDADHSKQPKRTLYFNNYARESGFYNFFSVINFTFKLLNRYCVVHLFSAMALFYICVVVYICIYII